MTHTSITAKVNIYVVLEILMKKVIFSLFALFCGVNTFAFGPSSLPDTGDWPVLLSWVLYALVVMLAFVMLGKFAKKAIKRHRQKHGK